MPIEKDNVVTFHYTLKNSKGELLESSVGDDPLEYLHGHRNIIPGLENALTGKAIGEKFTATIEPENGYGQYDDGLVQSLSRSEFQEVDDLQVGIQLEVEDSDGRGLVTVTEIKGEEVTVDGNHPLAGERLMFEVEVVKIRDGTAEELTHGHAHSPDGHHQ
jgi:FKBP-type peptidyl-prolyl cis-trans isomerase SlyD